MNEIMDIGSIILDNAGTITLQLGGLFAHSYDSADQAALDLATWLADADTSDYEGHEADALDCDPTAEEIRNGGYRVVRLDRDTDTAASLVEEIRTIASGWGNGEALADALTLKVKA